MKKQKVRVDFGDVIFVNAAMIADYAGVSRTKATQFIQQMKKIYKIDERRCLQGTVPATIAKDFFDFPVIKR